MRIAIMGAGRIGTWLAEEFGKEHSVAVWDIDRSRLETMHPGLRLRSLSALGDYAPRLFVNAVSLQHTVAAFEEAVPHLDKEKCVLADVASIKKEIAEYYRASRFRFVSVHPMFGPTFARMEKVREENAVIITESCGEGRRVFEALFARLGCRVFEYSFPEHDRMMAYSLTIPFVASLVFAAGVDKQTVPGTTFKRHMATARSLLSEDDHLLAEILFNSYSLPELDRLTSRLEFLKHIIRAKDQDEASRFFRKLREHIGEDVD